MLFNANGYADADVFDAGNNYDVAGFGFFQRHALQAFKAEQLVDAALGNLLLVVHHGDNLAGFDAAVENAADAEAAGVVVVVELGDLQLQGGVGIAAGGGSVFQDGVEQRAHIAALVAFFEFGKAAQA